MAPTQYQSRNPYLTPTQPSRATGLGGDLTVWIQTLSAMTRHASCSNVSKLQHFNFKETLIVKNKFTLRNYRAMSELSKSSECSWPSTIIMWCHLPCPALLRSAPNTPKSIVLPFTLTSWGAFLRTKAVKISTKITIVFCPTDTVRCKSEPKSGKCVCWVLFTRYA